MPNIASILKDEIARVARKEVRAETQGLKKAVSQYRTEIAALKRRNKEIEQQLKNLRKAGGGRAASSASSSAAEEGTERRLRFSAQRFADHRKRLGLSAQAVGALIGATGQSVYKWEQGKARPRAMHLARIAELRTLGKREAAARLEQLGAGESA
jgi:DNA-binding transcriptional regulator YiaG